MAPKKQAKPKAVARSAKTDPSSHPALAKLEERLTSPRLRPASTVNSYLVTAANFLSGLKDGDVATDDDFRRYFIRRRREKISERTLRKEFFHLKKLALANGWDWRLQADDAPYPEDEAQSHPLLPDQVEVLVRARSKLSPAETFYLAVATTWIVRREDLSRIKKRDFDGETFIIHHSKRGRNVRHLIPDALRPVFAEYRPKQHDPSTLSLMFHRICAKAGLEHQRGMGWHSLRHTLTTMIAARLPQNSLDPALIADYGGWSRKAMGGFFGGETMVGIYRHPDILDTDPHGMDKVIYGIHPFLPLWQKKR